ncbi:zinc-binding oxidoreductase CipB [Aspergillus eucalypticola CBS 122712]|uniref:Zinc-binding oxidoreductase CipB n=1 Tax=Aspergillus eucalypticola (strain CBS 122712 / IBT 29274) TaxID=1448314 RepID=A0A317VGZ8_ASPEC|nr:zinc-binding oxidoreductase CipB [Aspergillus eucalypticola CBS 122712]PWY72699.1 zinc-binding oxidoreductase CipB [Aspergillus eucalypticola CBS 122712]
MTQNRAAWITAPTEHPFTVQEAPYPTPGPGEILIKNAAISINPADWKIQTYGAPWLKNWPFVLGTDVAGVVVDVGPDVVRFTKGQRVVAYCHCLGTGNPANSGFQLYTLVKEITVAGIPDTITFEEASVLPQAISTAAAGLFLKESLDLSIPPPTGVKPTGKSILIWGGASSVGATTIQLAVAAGLTVITTASTHNHKLVKSLGATAVFDYKSSTVVDDVVNALTNTEFIGVYDAVSKPASLEMVRAVLDQLKSDVKTICVIPYDQPKERFAPIFISSNFLTFDSNKHVAEGIWRDFVFKALETGRLQPKPDPEVVGKGLEKVQEAVDILKRGVSAKKIIVTL